MMLAVQLRYESLGRARNPYRIFYILTHVEIRSGRLHHRPCPGSRQDCAHRDLSHYAHR